MLVLTRKVGESLLIGGNIKVMVVEVRGHSIRLGIEAPREIPVVREELIGLPGRSNPNNNTGTEG